MNHKLSKDGALLHNLYVQLRLSSLIVYGSVEEYSRTQSVTEFTLLT